MRLEQSVLLIVGAAAVLGASLLAQPPAEEPRAPEPAPAANPEQALAVQPPAEQPPAEANPETVVILKDGQRFTGFMIERTPEKVVLRIAGIDMTLKASSVERVEVLAPVEERYRQMRAVIDDSDAEQLLMLAEWLRVRARWDLALQEIDQALAAKPGHPEALKLRLLVQSEKELAEKPRVPRNVHGAGPGAQEGEPAFPLLSPAEINTIKVFEINLKDPPRMAIPRETVDQLIESYKNDRRMPQTPEERALLHRASPSKVLDLMFKLRARELYPQVKVIDQPRSMRLFRDSVHGTWLMNSCATTRCHGGAESGRLRLFNKRINTDETVYTNFVILERYRLPDGKPLINYDEPGESPLLQMGLARDVSKYPHPVVPAAEARGDLWKPFFRNVDEMRFQQAIEWIKAMYRPRPEYPIEYKPPTPEAVMPAADEGPVER
jgi:hypothetical protein